MSVMIGNGKSEPVKAQAKPEKKEVKKSQSKKTEKE
jgi:hypothetical protein